MDCQYGTMDWYCTLPKGHAGPHVGASLTLLTGGPRTVTYPVLPAGTEARPSADANTVACVNCKRPVTVTAINAVRCGACAAAEQCPSCKRPYTSIRFSEGAGYVCSECEPKARPSTATTKAQDEDHRAIGASYMEAIERYAKTQPGGQVFWNDDPVEVFDRLADMLEHPLSAGTTAVSADANTVACVNCKRPVTVTAINAVRCDDCAPAPDARRERAGEAEVEAEHRGGERLMADQEERAVDALVAALRGLIRREYADGPCFDRHESCHPVQSSPATFPLHSESCARARAALGALDRTGAHERTT